MDASRLERVRGDLVAWGVLEPEAPIRFTRRFQGALARAAASLQAEASGPAADPVGRQVERALEECAPGAGAEHRAFATAVQVASLPEAVRRLLGA